MYKRLLKVIVIGDSTVGKTTLVNKLVSKEHVFINKSPTIGVDFGVLYHNEIKIQIWIQLDKKDLHQ